MGVPGSRGGPAFLRLRALAFSLTFATGRATPTAGALSLSVLSRASGVGRTRTTTTCRTGATLRAPRGDAGPTGAMLLVGPEDARGRPARISGMGDKKKRRKRPQEPPEVHVVVSEVLTPDPVEREQQLPLVVQTEPVHAPPRDCAPQHPLVRLQPSHGPPRQG